MYSKGTLLSHFNDHGVKYHDLRFGICMSQPFLAYLSGCVLLFVG